MIREIRASKPPATAVIIPIRNNVVGFWFSSINFKLKVSFILAGKWANVAPTSTVLAQCRSVRGYRRIAIKPDWPGRSIPPRPSPSRGFIGRLYRAQPYGLVGDFARVLKPHRRPMYT
jgi:hypothetical protein